LRHAEFVDEICGALRMRGGREYRAAVSLHDFQPVRKVGGMICARLKRQFKIGTEESCAQLRNEFLLRIGVAAEAVAAEVAVKAVLAAGPMGVMPTSA
jgi:hypothetical protein